MSLFESLRLCRDVKFAEVNLDAKERSSVMISQTAGAHKLVHTLGRDGSWSVSKNGVPLLAFDGQHNVTTSRLKEALEGRLGTDNSASLLARVQALEATVARADSYLRAVEEAIFVEGASYAS